MAVISWDGLLEMLFGVQTPDSFLSFYELVHEGEKCCIRFFYYYLFIVLGLNILS